MRKPQRKLAFRQSAVAPSRNGKLKHSTGVRQGAISTAAIEESLREWMRDRLGVEHKYLTIDEVRDYLRISRTTAYGLIRRKELPALRLPRIVVDVDDLYAYVEESREKWRR